MFKNSYPPFSNLKMLIDLIGINLMLNEDLSLISLNYNSISCTKYRHHNQIPTRWSFILMELSLSIYFLFYYFIISHQIIQENNQKIKEIIQIIHIQPFIYYFSWALTAFFILSFISFSITGNSFYLSHQIDNILSLNQYLLSYNSVRHGSLFS